MRVDIAVSNWKIANNHCVQSYELLSSAD